MFHVPVAITEARDVAERAGGIARGQQAADRSLTMRSTIRDVAGAFQNSARARSAFERTGGA